MTLAKLAGGAPGSECVTPPFTEAAFKFAAVLQTTAGGELPVTRMPAWLTAPVALMVISLLRFAGELEHFPPDLGRYPYPAWRK